MNIPAVPDDLDAVRAVVDALKPFQLDDQRRIVRWAQEKLGHAGSSPLPPTTSSTLPPGAPPLDAPPGRRRDIKSFVEEKKPSSDNQFAAAVAYYYAFEAADAERKPEIAADDLQQAARLSGRPRLTRPINTLHDATRRGYLDKGSARGTFRINTVGENLVAMAMPGNDATDGRARPRPAANRKKIGAKAKGKAGKQ